MCIKPENAMKSANSRDGAGEAAPGSTQSQQKGSPKTQKKAKPSAQPLRRSRRIISNKTDGIVAGSSVVDVVEISEDAPSINSAVIVSTGAVEDAQSSDDSDVPLTKSRRRSIVNVIVIESSSDEADDTRGVCDNGSKVTNVCQEDRELRSKSDSIVVSGVDAKSAGERDAHSGSAADNGVSMAENGVSDDDSGGLGSRRRAGQIKRNRLESSSGESAVVSDAVVITGEEISNGVSTGKATAKRQGKRTRQIRHQIDISSEEAESVSDTNMANGHKISKSAGNKINTAETRRGGKRRRNESEDSDYMPSLESIAKLPRGLIATPSRGVSTRSAGTTDHSATVAHPNDEPSPSSTIRTRSQRSVQLSQSRTTASQTINKSWIDMTQGFADDSSSDGDGPETAERAEALASRRRSSQRSNPRYSQPFLQRTPLTTNRLLAETTRYNADRRKDIQYDIGSLSDFIAEDDDDGEATSGSESDAPVQKSSYVRRGSPDSDEWDEAFIFKPSETNKEEEEELRTDLKAPPTPDSVSPEPMKKRRKNLKRRSLITASDESSDSDGIRKAGLPSQTRRQVVEESESADGESEDNSRTAEKAHRPRRSTHVHEQKMALTQAVARGTLDTSHQFMSLYSEDEVDDGSGDDDDDQDEFIVSDEEMTEMERNKIERRERKWKRNIQKYNDKQMAAKEGGASAALPTNTAARARKSLALYKQMGFKQATMDAVDQSQIDVNFKNKMDYGKSLLHRAAETGNTVAVHALLKQGAICNIMDGNGMVALVYAIETSLENDRKDILSTLLSKTDLARIMNHRITIPAADDPDGNSETEYFSYLLHRMIRAKYMAGIEELLRINTRTGRDSVVNLKDQRGLTPLAEAALAGAPEIMSLLLKQKDIKVSTAITDAQGATLLHTAAAGGSIECFKLAQKALKGGAYKLMKIEDHEQMTPVMYAAEHGSCDILQYIVDLTSHNALFCKDSTGRTPLHMAAIVGDTECVKFLLLNLHPADVKDNEGWPPLLYADWGASEECISALFKAAPYQLDGLEKLWHASEAENEDLPYADGHAYGEDQVSYRRQLMKPQKQLGRKALVTRQRIQRIFEYIATVPEFYVLLNSHIRKNPSLMKSMYGFLLEKNSSLFDFQNKKTWFYSNLKDELSVNPWYQPAISLPLDRSSPFNSYADKLRGYEPDTWLENGYSDRLELWFQNEEGHGPGVEREAFALIGHDVTSDKYDVLRRCTDERTFRLAFFFNETDSKRTTRERLCGSLGTLIGMGLRKQGTLPVPLSNLTIRDMMEQSEVDPEKAYEEEDPAGYKGLIKLRNQSNSKMDSTNINGPSDDVQDESQAPPELTATSEIAANEAEANKHEIRIEDLCLTFEVTIKDDAGLVQHIPLKEGGADIDVTEANKEDYILSRMKQVLATTHGSRTAMESLRAALFKEVPRYLLQVFSCAEFRLLLNGVSTLSVSDWRAHTHVHNPSMTSAAVVEWFWAVVEELSQEEKSLLLMFATGSPTTPAGGFARLTGMDGSTGFNLVLSRKQPNSLPTASTCFNVLSLPQYESKKTCRKMMLIAIRHGSSGFTFS